MLENMKHVNVRMPEALLVALREQARTDARSLNSEIVHVLREFLQAQSRKRK